MTAEFVQIGDFAFQPAKIQTVDFEEDDKVCITFDGRDRDGSDVVWIVGLVALAFKEWWEQQANVYYIDPKWFDKDHPSNWREA